MIHRLSEMNFSVSLSSSIDSIIIQDDAETIFHIELPNSQNTISGWSVRFTYLRKTQPRELDELLAVIPQLLEIQVDEVAQPTYLNMLNAVFEWIDKEKKELEGLEKQDSIEKDLQNLSNLYQQLKHTLFNFEVITSLNNEYYEVIFPYPGREKLPVHISSDIFNKSPVQTSRVMLKKTQLSDPKYVEYFIHNYSHLQEYVLSADTTTFDVFTGLSKALVKLIKEEKADLGIYISLVPDICTFIVKNELDSEEQKEYLEPILSISETIDQKLDRLNGIILDVKNGNYVRRIPDQVGVKQFKEDGYRRLMHVISIISDHYLRLYDFDSSANFWGKARSKDPVLRFFLLLHRKPYLYVILQLALLIPPSIYAFQHWLTGLPCPLILGTPDQVVGVVCPPALDSVGPKFIIMLTWLTWYVFLVMLLVFIFTQILRKRWLYSQLLLPRILGAAIVGLLPLLLNDQSWNIGVLSSGFNWVLLALLTYIFSFIYIFIEVHNIKKYIKGHTIAQVLKESGRIFLIALSETLFFVTITSSLIFPAVISNIGSEIINYRLGIYASISLISFGFFPSLIILWTGIALFIGSFVQLIWQDQRITESI
jgi:hypothetical protein